MTPAERMAIVLALRDLAKHFDHLKSRSEEHKREIYTAADIWERGADMIRRTATEFEEGWTPSFDVEDFENYAGEKP